MAKQGSPRGMKKSPSMLFDILTEEDDKKLRAKLSRASLLHPAKQTHAHELRPLVNNLHNDQTLDLALDKAGQQQPHEQQQDSEETATTLMAEFTPRAILEELLGDLFIAPERLKEQGTFGEGAFATVNNCCLEDPDGGPSQLVAVKRLKPEVLEDTEDLRNFLLEANLQRKMRHKHIVSIKGLGARDLSSLKGMKASMYVVMEALQGGDLKLMVLRQMTSHSPAYSRSDALRWVLHVAQACHYLHHVCKPMIIHRDLKLENIMLTGGPVDSRTAKLTDFGLHKRVRYSAGDNALIACTAEWSAHDGNMMPAGADNEKSYYGGNLYLAGLLNSNPSVRVMPNGRIGSAGNSTHGGAAAASPHSTAATPKAQVSIPKRSSIGSDLEASGHSRTILQTSSTGSDMDSLGGPPDRPYLLAMDYQAGLGGASLENSQHGPAAVVDMKADAQRVLAAGATDSASSHMGTGAALLLATRALGAAAAQQQQQQQTGDDSNHSSVGAPPSPFAAAGHLIVMDSLQRGNSASLAFADSLARGTALPGGVPSFHQEGSVHRKMLALIALEHTDAPVQDRPNDKEVSEMVRNMSLNVLAAAAGVQQGGLSASAIALDQDLVTATVGASMAASKGRGDSTVRGGATAAAMGTIPEDRVRASIDLGAAPPRSNRLQVAPATTPNSMPRQQRAFRAAARLAGATSQVGSLMYMAPELVTSGSYNEKVDVFSLAIIMYELLVGKLLAMKVANEIAYAAVSQFGAAASTASAEEQANGAVMKYVQRRSHGAREAMPAWWPQRVRDLQAACWAQDPADRPDFSQIVVALQKLEEDGIMAEMDQADPANAKGCCTLM